jgi:hypothetical protein
VNLFTLTAQAATLTESCVEGRCAADIPEIGTVVANFLGIAAAIGGMLAVGFIILGGFKYIMARGDMKATQQARSTVMWAVLGLVFLVLAFLVLQLIETVTGAPVTQFSVPGAP